MSNNHNSIIPQLKEQSKTLFQSLSTTLLPNSNEQHHQIQNFLQKQSKQLQGLNYQNDQVIEILQDQQKTYNRMLTDIRQHKNKDHKFVEGGHGFLNAKSEEIKAKNKILESINTGMKESVSKIDTKQLALLPFKQQPYLGEIFQTLYCVLYEDGKQNFNLKKFRKDALEYENGEDFISLLANFNFRQVTPEHHQLLLMLKEDEKFKDICENTKMANDLVDLADWLDYVCMGKKMIEEKNQSEKQYEKIRKDINSRTDGSLQLKQEFCVTTLGDIQCYQNNMMNLQAQINTIIAELNIGVSDLEGVLQNRNQKIKKLNSLQ